MGEAGRAEDQLTRAVLGAAIAVHRALGPGFLEAIYEQALAVELARQGIPVERQKPMAIVYEGEQVGIHRLDLLVRDELIVELKAVDALLPIHSAQILSYLKATGLKRGLLINFSSGRLMSGVRRLSL